ncbi:hypothetical protein V5799_017561 [Amblyomma americanum]|uniref:Secreted protein n=1 Tax=Amblyomma americanum TaxID=6943 RepID=A0AAQ4F310_AMBAM
MSWTVRMFLAAAVALGSTLFQHGSSSAWLLLIDMVRMSGCKSGVETIFQLISNSHCARCSYVVFCCLNFC